jgi:hypothetical protein
MRFLSAVAAVLVLAACGTTSTPVASQSQISSSPSASPSSQPIPLATAVPADYSSPLADGTPVAPQVLAPATVLPAGPLCTTPVQVFQNGNAGPEFCRAGALNVAAWKWYEQLKPPVMAAGRDLSPEAQKAALCAPGPQNLTNVESARAYWLAAVYYGWTPIDAERILEVGGCR